MRSLPADFYDRPVLEVARDLIGCTVIHGPTAGVIVETEAYHQDEPACHAFVGLTARTRTLFGPAGRSYVYRSYGIHALLNAVCEAEGIGAAVLIRALSPVTGVELMRTRRRTRHPRASSPPIGAGMPDTELCSGPGKLTQALDIELGHNDRSLRTGPVRIAPAAGPWLDVPVAAGPRVGITRATELPWRFCVIGDRNVSRPRPDARASPGAHASSGARGRPALARRAAAAD